MINSVLKHNKTSNIIFENKKIDKWFITFGKLKNMKNVLQLLEPFKIVTEILDGYYTTASIALGSFKHIKS